jgi:hypothetical protein
MQERRPLLLRALDRLYTPPPAAPLTEAAAHDGVVS